jgi:7-cyano-7-deazaguanine synthase in queuosine biosynthesis
MGQIRPANVLRLRINHTDAEVRFSYHIDNRFSGDLKVVFPFVLDVEAASLLSPIGVGIATFLAQLCLARRIVLEFPCSLEQVQAMLPLTEMLYDVRCWKDRIDLLPLPEFVVEGGEPLPVCFSTNASKRACLLWSGGKDSTFGSILLAKNGFDVCPVHFTVNARKEEDELQAVVQLVKYLGLSYQTVVYQFPQYLEVARSYAIDWDNFPYNNTVPFGRDLALGLLTTLIAREVGATYLCMGHEHDSKTLYFDYQGKNIARNDVESTRGAMLLEEYIQRFISPTMKLLPPVGVLPEFRILYEMYTHYPDLMSRISFCFWGGTCGRCSKCLRYYLVGRVLGREKIINFQANPLEGENCPELLDYVNEWQDESLLYRDQVLYCMARLVERGDIRPGEHLLERFAKEIYPHIQQDLEKMGERIMRIYEDAQVPKDFRVP